MQKPDDNARLFECPISCMRKAETSNDNIPDDIYEEMGQKIIYMYKERGLYSETIAVKYRCGDIFYMHTPLLNPVTKVDVKTYVK